MLSRAMGAGSAAAAEHMPAVQWLEERFPGVDPEFATVCMSEHRKKGLGWREAAVEVALKLASMGGHYPRRAWSENESATGHRAKNTYLAALNAAFPHEPAAQLRRLIDSTPNTHILRVANALLDRDAEAAGAVPVPRARPVRLRPTDLYRDPVYIAACKQQLAVDFPNAWASSIDAVMAEHSHDYVQSHATLEALEAARSRAATRVANAIWGLFARKARPPPPHPELDADMATIRRIKADAQVAADAATADALNEAEYAAADALIECGCCYNGVPFERLVQCADGHLLCRECVVRVMADALADPSNVRIVACFDVGGECGAAIPPRELERALPADTWKMYQLAMQRRQAEEAGMALVKCPFCNYVEVIDPLRPPPRPPRHLLLGFLLGLFASAFSHPLVIIAYSFAALHLFDRSGYLRAAREVPPLEFTCRNALCERVSCRRCLCEAHAPVPCAAGGSLAAAAAASAAAASAPGTMDGLRLFVQEAMAAALVRVCAHCQLQFYKKEGCNKMVCKCGHIMCYVCRKDITEEKYAHFCTHFRQVPGAPCTRCDRCDLYRMDDEDEVAQEAGSRALKQYLARYPALAKQVASKQGQRALRGIVQQR